MGEFIPQEQHRNIGDLKIGVDCLPEEISEDENDIKVLLDPILIKKENNYLGDETEPNNKQQLTIQKTEFFCKDVVRTYNTIKTLFGPRSNNTQTSPDQKDEVQPNFHIAIDSEREEILEKLGMAQHLKENSLILIFRLPPFLAYPISEEDKRDGWDFLYNTLRSNLWDILHKYEQKHNLSFKRINKPKEHDPENYYYIWEVSLGNKRRRKLPHS